MAKKTKSVEDLEIAINQFLESNNYKIFDPFVGKCKGQEPYGERELGDAINAGDFDVVGKLIVKLSDMESDYHFGETGSEESKTEEKDPTKIEKLWDIDAKNAKAELGDKTANQRTQSYINDARKIAKKNSGSEKARNDLYKLDIAEKNSKKDEKYLEDKKKLAENYQSAENTSKALATQMSEKRGNTMEISKKDLTAIMDSMKVIQRHFAEEAEDEEVESQEVEDQVEDAEVEGEDEVADNQIVSVELPQSTIDVIEEAIQAATGETAPVAEETEFSEDDDYIDEETEEDSENFSEELEQFYDFSEAITETISNLNKKANKLADKLQSSFVDEYIENFSMNDFRNFAESITETLENISARVEAIDSKVKDQVTTNIDILKKTGDDYEDFITKSDDTDTESDDMVVENPEAGVVTNAQFSEVPAKDKYSYEKAKAFLS